MPVTQLHPTMYPSDSAANTYQYSTHYPNQYPVSTANPSTPIPYFAPFQIQPLKQAPVPETPPPDPPEPAVTPKVASRALQRLVTFELQNVGFEKAEQLAVQRLEHEVATCMS